MTSQQPDPLGTPLAIGFNQGINLDQVNENIYPVNGETAPHLTNTGVLRDNGVTNLYETTAVDSNGQYVMYAPNGKKISLDTTSNFGRIFVDGVLTGGLSGQAFGKAALASRVIAPLGAIDFAVATNGRWLLLTETFPTGARP